MGALCLLFQIAAGKFNHHQIFEHWILSDATWLREHTQIQPGEIWTLTSEFMWPFVHLCPEMQAMTKMADLTKFRQTDFGQIDDFHANYITWDGDFYANYITTDGVDMLADLTILAIFMQITSL